MKEDSFLSDIWFNQGVYNAAVRQRQERTDAEWMETYILGTLSELGQLLDSMRWKRHKLESIDQFGANVPQELADITKYVFSMWQLLGFTPEQMLEQVELKGRFLQQVFSQDFSYQLQQQVAVFDLDDVLADHRTGLLEFVQSRFSEEERKAMDASDIHLDLESGWRFDDYREAKNEFEASGGYRKLRPLYNTSWIFHKLRQQNISVVVWTARPVNVFKRVALDTFMWFEELEAQPDVLRFGRDERLLYMCELQKRGHDLVFIEDNPSLVRRASQAGIPIIVPKRPHNSGMANFVGGSVELLQVIQENLCSSKK